eukprot:Rhum_TRINITY_DN11766_c0_g1::Rhum_TRINITY_DN11766_c0_g1_i1::g.46613::m.46613
MQDRPILLPLTPRNGKQSNKKKNYWFVLTKEHREREREELPHSSYRSAPVPLRSSLSSDSSFGDAFGDSFGEPFGDLIDADDAVLDVRRAAPLLPAADDVLRLPPTAACCSVARVGAAAARACAADPLRAGARDGAKSSVASSCLFRSVFTPPNRNVASSLTCASSALSYRMSSFTSMPTSDARFRACCLAAPAAGRPSTASAAAASSVASSAAALTDERRRPPTAFSPAKDRRTEARRCSLEDSAVRLPPPPPASASLTTARMRSKSSAGAVAAAFAAEGAGCPRSSGLPMFCVSSRRSVM